MPKNKQPGRVRPSIDASAKTCELSFVGSKLNLCLGISIVLISTILHPHNSYFLAKSLGTFRSVPCPLIFKVSSDHFVS